MSQSHLSHGFPIEGAANPKAPTQELPSLMRDSAITQDSFGTGRFSCFMAKKDEKYVLLSALTAKSTST